MTQQGRQVRAFTLVPCTICFGRKIVKFILVWGNKMALA